MEDTRQVARELAHRGVISITQKGSICPLETLATLKGPIRLRLVNEASAPGTDTGKDQKQKSGKEDHARKGLP